MITRKKTRALGQHFLKDSELAKKIAKLTIEKMNQYQCKALLEIGPGKGALTYPLLQCLSGSDEKRKLILIEKDEKLAPQWTSEARVHHFHFLNADFLHLEESQWLNHSPLAVVSNLPYSCSTALLKKLALNPKKIPFMVLMFQAEVAKRLRAESDEKARGSLSVWIQNQWDIKKLFFVPPSAFTPKPQVDSEVVLLTSRSEVRVIGSMDEGASDWNSLLKVSFSQRRKMLRKVLSSSEHFQKALEKSGIDPTKRAQSLDWGDWNQLFQSIKEGSFTSK